jgi:hypothetical protein
MKTLALILLTGVCFSQTITRVTDAKHPVATPEAIAAASKPVDPPKVVIPDIPVGYQDQFKTVVIRQKDIQIDELRLQAQYNADVKAADQANADGMAIETKVLAQFKLDPAKYTTLYQGDKMVIVEKKK